MTKRKYNPPLKVDMDFDEALERFIQTDPNEIKAEEDERVRLVQDNESAHPLLIYATDSGIEVELPWRDNTLWATQSQMASMFGVDRRTVNEHLGNIYKDGELDEEATCRKIRQVRKEGQRQVSRGIPEYDLNAIISVGYRVGSKQGTWFRMWATDKLVQILTKGFYIDKERLKEPEAQNRIDEIKSILQDIRSDEANVHRELEQICAQCQDYNKHDPEWHRFFRETSAAIFYAAVQTPSEVIFERANAEEEDMGLRTHPKPKIYKKDVTVGKKLSRRNRT